LSFSQKFLTQSGGKLKKIRRDINWPRKIAIVSLIVFLVGCESGDESPPGPTPDGTAQPDVTAQPDSGTTTIVTPESCVCSVSGVLETSLGDIDYAAGAVTSEGQHLLQEGCVTEMKLQFTRDEGCQLDLTLSAADGVWTLSGGELSLDASCGLSGAEASHGTYTMESADATGALIGSQAAGSATEAACLDASDLSLVGKANFGNGSSTIEVKLNNLKLSGEVFSAGTGAGSCPTDALPCANAVCGSDEYGVQCGNCDLGYACNGGQCGLDICPPPEPYGTQPYLSLRDLTVFDCDGNPVHLHELCGKPVGYFNLLAGW